MRLNLVLGNILDAVVIGSIIGEKILRQVVGKRIHVLGPSDLMHRIRET
jgi:hypothetical protein